MQPCKNYFEEQLFREWVVKVQSKRRFAIGTKLASPYPNLFMTVLEKMFFQNSEFKTFLWLRYFDDIFDIWSQCSQRLKKLFNCITSVHPRIKFFMDYSATKIKF